MPRRKLTLSVEEEAIKKARRFSVKHGTSISQLVTDFLLSLDESGGKATPIVSRLRGVLAPDVTVEEYRDHLVEKYEG